MNIREVIRHTENAVIHLSVLPVTTAEQLQDKLWRAIGLWVPVEQISIKSDDSGRNFTALCVLDRDNLADALSRWLASVGERIIVAPAMPQRERNRIHAGRQRA